MNRDKYNDAWTNLLAARRTGNIEEILDRARDLCTQAALLVIAQDQPAIAPCSHFMVANGHCINCHAIVGLKTN